MLYERWRQVVREYSTALALCDVASGRRWTFQELAAAAESAAPAGGRAVFPRSHSVEFIREVLRGWRDGAVVCPLEPQQTLFDVREVPDGCVHLKTTSATTGAPRAIAFTAAQLIADVENIIATMGLRRDWPNLGVLSLAHSYGFSNLVLPLLLQGFPLILGQSPLPETIRKAASFSANLTLPGVPALWRAWHDAGALVGNIRLAISAGAPLPLPLEQAVFEKSGLKIHNFYGSSECGGIAYDASETPRSEAACVGAPMRHVSVTLGEGGCLEVRSHAVASGYWPVPDPTLSDGCYRTSDLAELRDGLVYLRGRATDQINVAGRKVSPEAIERVLAQHPAVRECLVFGLPNPNSERGESIVGCVVLNRAVAPETLRDFALTKLPDWQVPRDWWLVDALGTNQRGKLSRAEWRQRYLERKGVSQ